MCNEKKYINIQTGEELDLNRVSELKDNAMLKVKPELWVEWNFKKNDELGVDIYDITKGSEKKSWWYCSDCKSDYDMNIYSRVRLDCKCPYCRGLRVNHTNSLASINPDLAKEWHPKLNGSLTPQDITKSSGQKVWWQCKLGHKWKSAVSGRNNNQGCPYCSHNSTSLVGYNDMWTTNPELASLLADPEDGYKYTEGSGKKVNWECSDCGSIIKNKAINDVNRRRLRCIKCDDGISYPEKLLFNLLKSLAVEFEWQKKFKWSKGKVYDFYFIYDDKEYLIETHGAQHYRESTGSFHKKNTLQDIQFNDKYKYDLSQVNNIDEYIVIDCRLSEFLYIKNNIMNSAISNIFNLKNVNWDKIETESLKSKVIEICNIYNSTNKTITEISKEEKLSMQTIFKYLKKGNKVGLCNYTPNSEYTKQRAINKKSKKIVQLSLDGIKIKSYDSIKEAVNQLRVSRNSSIGNCCKGLSKSAYGFMWMYEEDYLHHLENKLDIPTYKRSRDVEVVQLSHKSEYINSFKTITEASEDTNVDVSNISNCCKGVYTQAGGYIWMYKNKYDDIISSNKKINLTTFKESRRIVQLNGDNELINRFSSIKEASEKVISVTFASINSCLNGKSNSSGGFYWMREKDYDNCINGVSDFPKRNKNNKIVKLEMNGDLICLYESLSQVCIDNNVQKANVVNVCAGKRKSTGGFKFMYLSDYENKYGKLS